MNEVKVFTIKTEGTDIVLKNAAAIKQEFANVNKILNEMGISNATKESVAAFTKELSKIVDIANLTEKEILDIGTAARSATKDGKSLNDVLNDLGKMKKLELNTRMIDAAIQGIQKLEDEVMQTQRLMTKMGVSDLSLKSVDKFRASLKMAGIDLANVQKEQEEMIHNQIIANKQLSDNIKTNAGVTPNGKGGKNSQLASSVGFQAQDALVMAQMGMDTSKIIAQQGSQLVSTINPMLGLAVAVGAVVGGIALD
jgi:K+/H+ antiporter YhaU regulatory subunit KhtT